jgi:hypothetical protein
MENVDQKKGKPILKYLGGLHNNLQKEVIIFNPRTVDEACV